jgi:serine/threonine protein kinase
LSLTHSYDLKQHIVQYIEHIDYDPYLYIIMEYVPGGDLGSMIGRHGRVEEPRVQLMAAQILDALDYLHGKGITHRDVKPDNILIHSHSPFQVKLTDFGLSKIVDTEETFLRTFCGTLLYCAPEVYSEYREYDLSGKRSLRGVDKKLLPPQRYDHAVDIWSLAGVLFFSLCASPPYPAKNGISYQELLNLIMTQPLDIKPLQKVNISDQGIRFVRSMLHNRPEHRATIADLQRHPWLTGASQDSVDEDMYIDDEADEVDLIQSGSILEQEASQLSLHEPMDDDVSDLTEVQQVEIPNSFNTSDGISNGNESYGFMQNAGNGRLFGEVDASVLGSSGAIPIEQLPVPTVNRRPSNDENPSRDAHHTQPTIIVPPRLPNLTATQVATRDADERVTRSSSLMGAESMVGHLNMHSPAANSPAAAMSPGADTPSPAADNISLRRAHDAISVTEGEWRPDLPPSKRRKSTRAIDLPATPQMFWDPKDKSTHHYNYPRMSIAEWNTYQELAQERGEVFDHGHSIFESTLASFRTSRSPSLEPERARIQSEPIPDEGKRGLKRDEGNIGRMRRDERDFGFIISDERSELGLMKRDGQEPKDTDRAVRLTDGPRRRSADMAPIGVGKGNEERELPKKVERKRRLAIDPQLTAPKDQSLPATAHGSNQPSPHETDVAASHGVVGNDFQPPKRILGKIISTPDSCLPTISLNIVDTVTSWGRGYLNTMRYSNAQETRVPKYAFKIFAFKTDNDWASTGAPAHGFETTGLTFYISTKASAGIFVNTVKVSSHDAHNPETASKYWGEIRHGDLITVWWHDKDFKPYTRLRFECYHGESKVPRKEGEKFQLLKDEAFIKQLNNACDVHENEILHTLGNTS